MANNRTAAWADESYTDPEDPNSFMVILVDENQPGYHATTYTGSLEYVKKVAASINDAKGISHEDALLILSSSMRASNV